MPASHCGNLASILTNCLILWRSFRLIAVASLEDLAQRLSSGPLVARAIY